MPVTSPAARVTPATAARLSLSVLAAVVLVNAIAPLATDMYVPAFPAVGADLGVSASQVQLTLTTFFVGMALGQLVGGPFSDGRGRRRPLLLALVVLAVASIVCGVSSSLEPLLVARFVQGLSGGWAMVVARAIVIDLASGPALVRALNAVAGVGGIALVGGPLLGGVLLELTDWRVSFWVVAGLAVAMVIAVLVAVPESLPPSRRRTGGLGTLAAAAREVLGQRRFVGYLLVMALSMGVTFSYVASSTFILQTMNGLSPIQYSMVFAANAAGLTLTTMVAARLAGRTSTDRVIAVGLTGTAVAGVILLVGAIWFAMPLAVAVVGFFVLMSAQGLIGPNAGALASDQVPQHPGTGSAVLGVLQWSMAGLIAPLTGLGGDTTAVPMAVIVLALVLASTLALGLLARPRPVVDAA
ncbi:multidrug effflux MFS transporter [Pseudactinotalea suaedae]|uniref:multidrug effflux MFS transporter n=1 Tax=Pseudactinotalea suaedae TaxID=1524924 RepID=UPI0012E2628F|nr:multidrug effflux MFS transporter [Pseudactinotalea suaedae]